MHNKYCIGKYSRSASIGIATIVFNSFMVQYFVDIIHSYVLYIAALLLGCVILAFSAKRNFAIKKESILLWYIVTIMMVLSLAKNAFDINTFADLATFLACVFMCSMAGNSRSNFYRCFRVIRILAVYYAVTVWIQLLLPSVYNIYLHLMPVNIQSQILVQQHNLAYTGFSSNLGFTAGHIMAGILLLMTVYRNKGIKYYVELIFLFFTLFLTGKRSTFIFLLVALVAIYLVSTIGIKKINRIFFVILTFLVMLIGFFIFQNQLKGIPVFNRIIETINGLRTGEDISSRRSMIYLYAVTLFRQNPIVGIGWGYFRSMTLGNITWVNTVEVHNIYLQLLCETGIVGFIIMIIPMVIHLIHSYRAVRYEVINKQMPKWFPMLLFAFSYQVFFLLYGIVENALYDYNFLIMYFLSCAIVVVYERVRNKMNKYVGGSVWIRRN